MALLAFRKTDPRFLKGYVIFNPSTRIFKEISLVPPCDYRFPKSLPFYGFGFDDVSNDYKLVNLNRIISSPGYIMTIYSLRANSWKVLHNVFQHNDKGDTIISWKQGTLVDNHLLHWAFYYHHEKRLRIGCFDLRTEQWSEHLVPDYIKVRCDDDVQFHLGVFEGCLYLFIDDHKRDSSSKPRIWVMKDYGVKESWVQMFGATLDKSVWRNNSDVLLSRKTGVFQRVEPLEYCCNGSKEDEIFVWDSIESQLRCYNCKARSLCTRRNNLGKINKLRTYNGMFVDAPSYSHAFSYVKSLVSIPAGKQI